MTILFIVSFIALVSLVLFRVIENRYSIGFLKKFYEKGDLFIESSISYMYVRYSYFIKVSQIFIFEFIPSLIYEFLVKSKDYVARRYYNQANEFRGRRMLRNDGSVSAFLEQLSGDK